jgi:hypothetical protein
LLYAHRSACSTLWSVRPSRDTSKDRRATVVEAAASLGITPDAVRSRLRRGTLRKDRGPDGEVLVVLDGRQSDDRSSTGLTTVALIEALQDQIASLKTEVEAWREEARRKDDLLATALERIPLGWRPLQSLRDARETATEASNNASGQGEEEVLSTAHEPTEHP